MNLNDLAHMIVVVLRDEVWKCRRIRTDEIVECASFLELLTAPLLRGFGEAPARVEALLRDRPEALRLFRTATTAPEPPPVDPDVEASQSHNDMLGMAKDTVLRLTTLPRMMRVMLTTDGWRRLVRPIDKRVFENATIEDWVLGQPWPGLHFPDWATVYALLAKSIEVGPECITRLQAAGAPSPEEAERVFRVRPAKEGPVIQPTGRPKKGDRSHLLLKGSNPSRLAARLRRDHPDIFLALERGEHRSVRAAAKAAGLIKEKSTLEQLLFLWRRTSLEDRHEFLRACRVL